MVSVQSRCTDVLRKTHMCSIQSLKSCPSVAFKTVHGLGQELDSYRWTDLLTVTDRLTDRETDLLTERQTYQLTDRHSWKTDRLTNRETDLPTDRLTDRDLLIDRLTDWETDSLTDKHSLTVRQTHRQSHQAYRKSSASCSSRGQSWRSPDTSWDHSLHTSGLCLCKLLQLNGEKKTVWPQQTM